MRKILPFTFGVLVGTVVATAWAQFPYQATVTADAPSPAVASMNPHDMMMRLPLLPVQRYDAH